MYLDSAYLRHVLLTVIADHDGKYGWYTLSNAVFSYDVDPQPPAIWVVRQLVSEGLLSSFKRDDEGRERYLITSDGSAQLAQLDSEQGALPYLEPGVGMTPRGEI